MEVNPRIAMPVTRSWLKSLSRVRNHELPGFWAIADQGVVSLGNFLTTIILARAVTPTDYGVWTVLFGSILFLNVVPASLITYPLTVRLASPDDGTEGQLIFAGLALTGVLVLPQTLVLFALAAWIGGSSLALWASVGLLLWQLQETTRRILMARLAFRAALFTDAISYLGQAGLFWLLARSGRLSPEIGFAVLGMTCGVAAIAQLLSIQKLLRVSIKRPANFGDCARTFWATGRWILGTNLLTNFSIQSVPWALFLLRGPAEAASFQAISNLLGVSHPIVLSLGNIVVPAAARARVKDGLRAARQVALRQVTQGGLLLLPYVGALLIFPRQILGFFYSSSSPYLLLDFPLRLLAVIYVLNYFSMTLRFLLNALEEKNRVQFVVELCGSLLLGGVLVLLVLWLGMSGAILATGLWTLARLTSNVLILRQVKA